jgi:succinate-semialdehyde dehydrogenase/glutarate-semialdehyde dehydrogenase
MKHTKYTIHFTPSEFTIVIQPSTKLRIKSFRNLLDGFITPLPEGKGFFYPPTVITNVPDTAECLRDEIFGPVAMIQKFTNQDEVISRANDTEYGLVAYLYTEDLKRGLQVSEKLDYGMIGLNRGLVSDPAAPFGGVKQSGLGREGGHEGMLEFMETQYISVTW